MKASTGKKSLGLSAAAVILLTACGPQDGASGAGAQKAAAAVAKAPAVAAGPQAPKIYRSVFTIDGRSRDPFFPHPKKAAAPAGDIALAVAEQRNLSEIPALLAEGLQGIVETGDERIALLYNVLLEPGRTAVIPLRIGNRERPTKVRCVEVTRTQVVVEVEGHGPLVISRKPSL